MANILPSLLHLLIFLALLFPASSPPPTASSPSLSPPSPPHSPSPPPPSPPSSPPPARRSRRSPRQQQRLRPRRRQQPPSPPQPTTETAPATPQQFNNIIDALIGSGDFSSWVSIISSTILPLSATLFVPQNDAVNPLTNAGDPFIFPYHVVPQRLSFAELQLFPTNTRLPTLLAGKSIIITNNSRLNFTIDGSPVTQPDLYATATLALHGVAHVFDYSVYGDSLDLLPEPSKPPPQPDQSQVFRPAPPPPAVIGDVSGWSSMAAPPCLCVEFPVVFLVFCVVLMFKI